MPAIRTVEYPETLTPSKATSAFDGSPAAMHAVAAEPAHKSAGAKKS